MRDVFTNPAGSLPTVENETLTPRTNHTKIKHVADIDDLKSFKDGRIKSRVLSEIVQGKVCRGHVKVRAVGSNYLITTQGSSAKLLTLADGHDGEFITILFTAHQDRLDGGNPIVVPKTQVAEGGSICFDTVGSAWCPVFQAKPHR